MKKKYSKLVKKTANEILSFNPEMNKLEKEYEYLKDHNIAFLSSDQLQIILAYEMWKDGMEWADVKEIKEGTNPLYIKKEKIINELKSKFNY